MFVDLIVLSAVISFLAFIFSLVYWNRGGEKLAHFYFLISCAPSCVFMVATAGYYQSPDISSAGWAIRVQDASELSYLICIVLLIARLLKNTLAQNLSYLFAAITGVAVLASLAQPYSLRYENLNEIQELVFPWGEVIQAYSGQLHPLFWVRPLLEFTMLLGAIAGGIALLRRGNKRYGLIWTCFGIASLPLLGLQNLIVTLIWIPIFLLIIAIGFALVFDHFDLMNSLKQEVEARQKTEARITAARLTDNLTGLPNALHLSQYLDRLLAHKSRSDAYLFLIGIHDFKAFNELHGRDAGDRVLKAISYRLTSAPLHGLFFAREQGNGFAIVFPDIARLSTNDRKMLLEQRIPELFGLSDPFMVGYRSVFLNYSVAGVQLHNRVKTARQAMEMGNLARDKSADLNKGVLYDESLARQADDMRRLEIDFVRALEHDELLIYWQPLLSRTGKIVGAEVFSRWKHKEHGWIDPSVFMRIAERHGLTEKQGWTQMRQVCELAVDQRMDPISEASIGIQDFRISLNITANQLEDPDFATDFLALVEAYNLKPSGFEIDISESMALLKSELVPAHLKALHNAGVKIAIDDFGTGFSSLTYFASLPIDKLKIDSSFIAQLHTQRGKQLVKAAIEIADALNMEVMAEGVETEEQLQTLIGLGCQFFQGYYFAKPMEASHFQNWLWSQSQSATSPLKI